MNKTAISWAQRTWNLPYAHDTFHPVLGHPGYTVNIAGKIRGPSLRVLKPQRKASGHLYVTTGPRGSRRTLMVHRAVLQMVYGDPPDGMEGRHLDGDPVNNHFSNLRWGTRVEQREDDRRNGVVRLPEHLTLDQVKANAIRERHGHASSRQVAIAFGVSHTTVQKIWRGQRWVQKV